MNLGQVVRRAREDADLRQEDLAEKIGMSQSALSRIERGTKKRVMVNDLDAIEDALGLARGTLLVRAGRIAADAITPELLAASREALREIVREELGKAGSP